MEDTATTAILLIDDDEDCLLFMRESIEEFHDGPVHEANSGGDALNFLCRRGGYEGAPAIGLVYLDVEMPGMHGQDVLKKIRSNAEFDALPVVMMSAVTDDAEIRRAARSGANSYVVKPHDVVEFAKTLETATRYWLGIHKRPGSSEPPSLSTT